MKKYIHKNQHTHKWKLCCKNMSINSYFKTTISGILLTILIYDYFPMPLYSSSSRFMLTDYFFCISVFFYIESNSYLVVYISEIKYFCDIEKK